MFIVWKTDVNLEAEVQRAAIPEKGRASVEHH